MIPVIFIALVGSLTLVVVRWNHDPASDFDTYM